MWNQIVSEDDFVIHLGDLFVGDSMNLLMKKEFVNKLNGKIHLVRGNHDKRSDQDFLNMGITGVSSFFVYEPYFFCHYSLLNSGCKEFKEQIDCLKEEFNNSKCKFIFHGHSHRQKQLLVENHYNCVACMHDFKPINLIDKVKELKWI
jgi:calcineurin-like phosphoesterase family protein